MHRTESFYSFIICIDLHSCVLCDCQHFVEYLKLHFRFFYFILLFLEITPAFGLYIMCRGDLTNVRETDPRNRTLGLRTTIDGSQIVLSHVGSEPTKLGVVECDVVTA